MKQWANLAILPRFGAAAFALAAVVGCQKAEPPKKPPDQPAQAAATKEPSSLAIQLREAHGHRHLSIEQRPPALELRLTRPKPEDRSILLCVAGTYTSPEGRAEGLIALDGSIVASEPKPWEGLLIVKSGVPTLMRSQKDELRSEALLKLIGTHGSLMQGHLLVDGTVQRLKASPALRRRAIATRTDGSFFLAESQVALPLAEFAADLLVLGARYALNLDMGEWSEGFYRDPITEEARPLGDDYRRTSAQSNWLVLVKPER